MPSQTVSQAVEKRDEGIDAVVAVIKSHQHRIAPVLPDHIDVDQFVGLATGALFRDVKLIQAARNNPGALMNALMRCAALGHQPGTEEFYLIPRKNKKNRNLPEVQGIEGYRGIVERMYRSGAVASVVVREVCAKDRFRYVEGVTDRPQHNFSGADAHDSNATGADFFGPDGSRGRGPMVGVYAYAVLTTGSISRVVLLSRDDVMAAKNAGDGGDSEFSPWNRLDAGPGRPEFKGRSMWWKTAARRLEPWVPTSAQFRKELARAAAEAQRIAMAPGAPSGAEQLPVEILDGEGEWYATDSDDPPPLSDDPPKGEDWPPTAQPGQGAS